MVHKRAEKAGLPQVQAVLADGYAAPIPSHSADVIYALDMFHSVSEPELLLCELHRLTKPEGVLFLEDGHQPRAGTRRKVHLSGLWEITAETRNHVRCVPRRESAR